MPKTHFTAHRVKRPEITINQNRVSIVKPASGLIDIIVRFISNRFHYSAAVENGDKVRVMSEAMLFRYETFQDGCKLVGT